MSSNAVKSRKHAEELLLQHAAADPAFRKRLLANPREAIAHTLAMPLPANVKVTVVEETDQHIYLVLPAKASGELADEELLSVAGGVLPAGVSPTAGLLTRAEKGRATPGMGEPPDPVHQLKTPGF